ncbi:nitroreductase family protein [Methanoculleus sp. Wushi-C6]|uniref:Nitroreductase family protein n=1 Tax=Methanoculleus caldifontis TaxID=2651577 RepID=A0ABU3WY14_9EURY|nr:nitroreductase family protein [Methanoculleus sp. Wushi-C6]MDV2480616.1 nitroreductase family protein [Methanoculleus sp. Wushi-C6]
MDTLEVIMTRRSVREYTDRPVPAGTVRQLLAAAMQAPFAGGEPPWHFIVIDDPHILDAVPAISPYVEVRTPAPLAVLVCADLHLPEGADLAVQGCAAATENLLLAAHALGLGAVWTAVYPDPDRMLGFANLFSLPGAGAQAPSQREIAPFALVTVGHPAVRLPPIDRYREDRVHRNAW